MSEDEVTNMKREDQEVDREEVNVEEKEQKIQQV